MFFNYDSFEIVTIALVISGIMIYSFYSSSFSFTAQNNNESLVLTNSSLNSISNLDSNIQSDNIPFLVNVQAKVDTAHIQVDVKVKVEKKIDNLNSNQSIDHHDSESSLANVKIGINSILKNLVGPDDSGTNITEVISEANLQKTVEPQITASNSINKINDTSNQIDLAELMSDPTVFCYFDIVDNNIYFYTDSHCYSVIRDVIIEVLSSVN